MRGQSYEVEDPPLRFPCLRLLVPPLRLVSAAIWWTIQERVVADYGMVEEFITMATEIVPGLLNHNQRAQLLLGLRARLILEHCHSEPVADLQTVQPHFDRMETLITLWGEKAIIVEEGLSRSHFFGLIQTLLKDPDERQHFFQDVFPLEFGPKYDKAIQALVWQFLSRLEELLQVPKLQEVASLLGDVPSVLEECVASVSHPQELKTLLEYQKDLVQLEDNDSNSYDDCILSALCPPPVESVVIVSEQMETHMESLGEELKARNAAVKESTEIGPNTMHVSGTDETHQSRTEDCGGAMCFVQTDETAENVRGEFSATMEYIGDIEPNVTEPLALPKRVSNTLRTNEEIGFRDNGSEDAGDKMEVCETVIVTGENEIAEPLGITASEKNFSEKSKSHITTKSSFKRHKSVDGTVPTSLLSRSERPNRGLKMKTFLAGGKKPLKIKLPENEPDHSLNSDEGQHHHADSEQQTYKCLKCGKCFHSNVNLRRHVHSFCSGVDKKSITFKCTVCGKTFPRAAQVKCHMISHSSECPYQCSNCERSFKCISSMKAHKEACLFASQQRQEAPLEGNCGATALGQNNSEPFNTSPQKTSPETTGLSDDCRQSPSLVQNNTEGSLYQCLISTKSFKVDNLKEHQCDAETSEPNSTTFQVLPQPNKVAGELAENADISLHSLKCSVCDKAMQSSEEMVQHLRTHSSTGAFKCKSCQKPYKYLKHFQKHYELCKMGIQTKDENSLDTASETTLKPSAVGGEMATVVPVNSSSENSDSSRVKLSPDQLSPTVSKIESHSLTRGENVVCGTEHQTTCHFKENPLSCPSCGTTFKTRNIWRYHITQICKVQSVNPEYSPKGVWTRKKHNCDECGKEFGLRPTLIAHKLTHNPLYCAECRKVCPDPETLAAHNTMHEPVQCTMCDKSFNVIRTLMKHYINAHQFKGPFVCTHCQKSYSKLGLFIKHERTHTGDLPFHCTKCPKKFSGRIDLISHKRKHTGEKQFLCWECGKTFSSTEILKRHMECHSGQEKSLSCPQCKRTFWAKKEVDVHVQIHHKGKPFPCTYGECGKSFRSSAKLKIHNRYHTGERPFKCQVCEKGFVQAYSLTIHLRSHTQERPYACPVCDRRFNTGQQLNRHKLIHTREKPYGDEGFSRKHRLRAHQEKHHRCGQASC